MASNDQLSMETVAMMDKLAEYRHALRRIAGLDEPIPKRALTMLIVANHVLGKYDDNEREEEAT